MPELFLFYWYSWLLIIIVYFFVEKIKLKHFFLYTLFSILLLVHVTILFFGQIKVTGAFIVLIISSLYYYIRSQFSYYDIFVTITVILCYNGLLMWKKLAPIWFVINPLIMIPLIICSLIIVLTTSLYKQIAIVMIGLTIGQLLFGFILIEYSLYGQLGDLYFFIIFFSHILLLFAFRLLVFLYRATKRNTIY